MTQINIKPSIAEKLEKLSQSAEKSVDEVLDFLLNQYGQGLLDNDKPVSEDDVTWTDEEIEAMLTPKKALTGKEIVERGLLGGWADEDISDGLEWVEQQRANRRKKHQWYA